jgi:nucleotide-binding universal stress UspA family protein
MIKNGKIVVPTDFSEQSSEALKRACVLALQFEAQVHLLHVMEPPVYIDADLVLITPIDTLVKAQHQASTKHLIEQAKSVEIEVVTHLEDAERNVAQTICDFSKALEAELIVIGRHSEKGMIEHMILGSTAERVVRHAPCSVLVVMPHGIFAN